MREQEAQLIKDSMAGQLPTFRRQRRGCLANLFRLSGVAVLGVALLYVVLAVTAPWSFHMGGRWTPLATWRGYGQLRTKSGGEYPLYVSFFPGSHFSPLHLDGLRPTGGLKGSGWICTSPGAIQHLDLTGTIYGAWRSTDGGLLTFRLLEPKIIDVGQGQGFFDLTGRWQGGELVMDDRGGVPEAFRSGLRIEHASVSLSWGTYSEFKELCAKATNHSADR